MFLIAKNEAHPKCKYYRRITPLHEAIRLKRLDFVQFLEPLEFWYEDDGDHLPLSAALSYLMMINPGAIRPANQGILAKDLVLSPLNYAIHSNAIDIALWIIKNGKPSHLCRPGLSRALTLAIMHNMLTITEALLQKMELWNIEEILQKEDLHTACSAEAVKLLLRYGFNKEIGIQSLCIFDERLGLCSDQKFLEDFSREESRKYLVKLTPLHSAVLASRYEVVKALLEAGASPAACDESGFTPLHTAAQKGDCPIIEALMNAGLQSIWRIK